MKKHNSEKHHRRSIRIKGFDYSSVGSYYITLCSQNRENYFGKIVNNEIELNNAGKMVKKWVIETNNKFKNTIIDEYIIMPNHLHLIITIITPPIETDQHSCLKKNIAVEGEHIGSPLQENYVHPRIEISIIITWLKTMTTNEYINGVKNEIYAPFNKHLWQRNYYERIIRNENEFNKIREYIINNPVNWLNDENNIEQNS